MTITFIGHGYVGLVTAAVFADLGNTVWVIGHTKEKIENLKQGVLPIYEPGLEEIVKRNVKAKRLLFTLNYDHAIPASEIIFIAVGTPTTKSGEADLNTVFSVSQHIGKYIKSAIVVAVKSTVPVGTNSRVKEIIAKTNTSNAPVYMASVPEFLREGQAISDTLHPDRIIIGTDTDLARDRLIELHKPIEGQLVATDIATAEMIKYASNAFLATKISFANAIARLSELTGSNGLDVLRAVGLDKRVGSAFLQPGAGYGGSCFESQETIFSLNSPNIVSQRLDDAFRKGGKSMKGDIIEFVQPARQQVLAFDLQTQKPTIAQVTSITKRPYKGTMISIKTQMGRVLRVTADHPVILYKNKSTCIVPAAAVVKNDRLMALSALPQVTQASQINLLSLLKDTELGKQTYITSTNNFFSEHYKKFASSIPPSILKYPDEIKRNNRMSLPLYFYLEDKVGLNTSSRFLQLYTAKGSATKNNAIIPIDKDFMRFCGYFLAEGWISQDKGRKSSVRERIGICFNENEHEYIHDVQNILKKWGMKYTAKTQTHATSTIVSSRIFSWLLKDVLHCGVRSDNKMLPLFAYNVSETLRKELLKGIFRGDGSVAVLQKGKNIEFEYATVSKLLADGVVLLLQTIGIVPSIHKRWMNKSKQPAYIIRVSGYKQIRDLKDVFGQEKKIMIENVLNKYQRFINQRGFIRFNTFATLAVKEVVHEITETTVYSMETSTGTLITSSGLISHNCFPKDVKALIAIARQHEYSFDLLKAVEQVNDDAMHAVTHKATSLLGDMKGKTIGILGLSFKPDTDDMRDAPSLVVIDDLQKKGANIRAYDPIAMENAKRLLSHVTFCDTVYDVAKDTDAVIVITEWNEFKELDLVKLKSVMRGNVLIDCRNIYDPTHAAALGFVYKGVGR